MTDHMFIVDYDAGQGWHDARIIPYGPLQIDPAAKVLHYGEEIFEVCSAVRRLFLAAGPGRTGAGGLPGPVQPGERIPPPQGDQQTGRRCAPGGRRPRSADRSRLPHRDTDSCPPSATGGQTQLGLVACLGLYSRESAYRRRKEINKYLDSYTGTVDSATKDTMINSPLPMVLFRPESDLARYCSSKRKRYRSRW